MRKLLLALALGVSGVALLPSHQAKAWYDRWGYWHPNYYRPPVVVAPPPVAYYAPPRYYAARPYARWVPPHWNRWGQWVPGHWA